MPKTKPRIKRKRIEKVTSSKEWRVPDADYHKGQKPEKLKVEDDH